MNKRSSYIECIFESAPAYPYQTEQRTYDYIDLDLAVQYKINMPSCLQACPLLGKLTNYIGIVASPSVIFSDLHTEASTNGDSAPAISQNSRQSELSASLGLNHTMVYALSSRFNLISTAEIRAIAFQNYYNAPNLRAGLSIGASYNIK